MLVIRLYLGQDSLRPSTIQRMRPQGTVGQLGSFQVGDSLVVATHNQRPASQIKLL